MADSLCVDVLANVILVYENDADFVDDYREALESALNDGRLEGFVDEIGSEIEIIVFDVGPIGTEAPTDDSNSTVAPTTQTGENSTMTPSITMAPTAESTPTGTKLPTFDPTPTDMTDSPTAASVPTLSPTSSTTTLPSVNPIRFFVIAGDSNVVGFADLNHLVTLSFSDPAFSKFVTPFFSPVERADGFVTFNNEYGNLKLQAEGLLSTQYGTDGGHFGPEVGLGWDLADLYEESIVVIKGGGTGALASQWLPPSSGGPGDYYTQLVDDIKGAMSRADAITGTTGQPVEFAGLIWFHGYDDVFNNAFKAAYETNLQNLISDIRAEFQLPNLPIVIAELGAQGDTPDQAELEMRDIQKRVVDANAYTILSTTSQFVTGFDKASPTDVFDGAANYWGRADVMISIGYQFAADISAAKTKGSGTQLPDDDIVL